VNDRGRRRSGEAAQTAQALLALAIAAYIGTAVVGDRASATRAAVTYVVVLIASVVLHEAGHAVAVVAIGGRIREVRLGFGPVLYGRVANGIRWDIRPLIIAGHVGWEPPPNARRNQLVAVAGAGIAVHVVLALVAVVGGSGPWTVWRIDLLIANVLAIVANAIPATSSVTTTAAGPNDGAHLRALFAGAHPESARRGEPAWVTDQRGVAAALAPLLAAGLPPAENPNSPAGQHLSRALSLLPSVEAALVTPLPDPIRAAAAHTVALARLAAGRNADAERLAASVLPLLPEAADADRAAMLSTIGWAALRQGRRRDAEQLLGQAMTLSREDPMTVAFGSALSRTPRA
jgi:hypothetical protein